jgi:hypothetical protein
MSNIHRLGYRIIALEAELLVADSQALPDAGRLRLGQEIDGEPFPRATWEFFRAL